MKTLLTIIILILITTFSLLLIKEYGVRETPPITAVINVTKSTSVTKPAPTDTKTDERSTAVENDDADEETTAQEKNSLIDGLDVDKLVMVASSQGLKPKALKSALNAYVWALDNGKLGKNKGTLTVVDFTLPSYQKRLWVLDLHQNKVLMKLHTTQGSGSGLVYATRFSNTSRTQASSLGLYTTSEKYTGKHGVSMRLNGLQKGINNNARSRAIVIHEAQYVTPAYIKANHRAGRSWGCFAIDPASKNRLLNYVKDGSAFFAYAHSIEKTPIVSHGPISI